MNIGSQEIFLIIVCPELANPKDVTYWILLIIENLITCLALVHVTRLIRAFGRTSLFHKNLVRLSQAILVIFYPNVLARVIITSYEVGILAHDGSYLSNVLTSCACLVRVWTTNLMILYFPSVIIERIFASNHITDYEKLPRPWICRAVIPFVYATSIFTATSQMLGYTNDVIVSILVNGLFLISCIACITLFHLDVSNNRGGGERCDWELAIYFDNNCIGKLFTMEPNSLCTYQYFLHNIFLLNCFGVYGCS
nr:unnamed protein product [Haemonchus contortus]